ncbi:hypothetical protein EYF80_031488 [Liparis tanakae]|uniref:Uncharacterized protein n=1 Tax=Liparis tanakae TaxID=230148 RepID=A0A4Z2GYY6_9TELE|nr:hypothetical protein EYF80_031488 [Liparis tanakae]
METGRHYLDGSRGDLDVVQLAQSALSVDEVGGGQLVQSFQSHGGGVTQGNGMNAKPTEILGKSAIPQFENRCSRHTMQ